MVQYGGYTIGEWLSEHQICQNFPHALTESMRTCNQTRSNIIHVVHKYTIYSILLILAHVQQYHDKINPL